MTRPAAVVFDFDGVLVESDDIKAAAFRELFSGESPADREAVAAFLEAGAGLSRFVKLERIHRDILGRPLDAEGVTALAGRFAALVVDAVVNCPPVPGASAFVARLAAGNVPLFIVSATPEDELRDILRRRGMEGPFRAVRGSPRGKLEHLRDLSALHDFDPAAAVMIGDGRQDWEAASGAGLRFVGRVRPGRPNPFPPEVPIAPDLAALERSWPTIAGL